MITTGWPYSSSKKTDVVDVVSGESCGSLAQFPVKNDGAVGTNLDGTPVVCGGMGWPKRYKTCYKFTNAGWQEFANMKEKRYLGAGIMYKNKFHVFGGFDGSNWGQTSEIISIDGGVEYGPEIPVATRHEITSINATVSVLSGGTTLTNSHPTWLFNHETQAFSFGPSLLEGRYAHGSATVVDKVTTAKIPIVTGGSGNNGIMDSTEMLINGIWQSGTIQLKETNKKNILIGSKGQEISRAIFLKTPLPKKGRNFFMDFCPSLLNGSKKTIAYYYVY